MRRAGGAGARALALAAAAGLALAGGPGCQDKAKVRRRSGDAGPAVVVVDQGPGGLTVVAEREPNDDPAQAQTLAVPGGVKGAIDRAGDADHYVIEIAEPGVLKLRVAGIADADLVLELEDAAGGRLVISDNGPKGVTEGVPNWTVAPGKYRVIVSEFVKKPPRPKKPAKAKAGEPDAAPAPGERAAPSAPYVLEATLVPAAPTPVEVEPNDSAAFASALGLPGSARGYAGWRKDRDVWKVPLADVAEDEALSIDVDGVADVALRVAVLDGTEAVLLERQGRPGEAVALRNVAVRAGEPHYYVSVAATTRGNPDETYEVRAASAPLELDEETEPNDSPAKAGPLADIPADGGLRVGFLARGDTDVYKLDPAPIARELHITVEPPAGSDVVLSIVDAAGAPIAPSADAGKGGAPERISGVIVAPEAVVYVKLAGKSGDASERYRLRWSAAATAEVVPVPGVDDVE